MARRFPKYFTTRPKEGFVPLYLGKTIIMIGYAMLGLFFPIFLYELFGYNAQYTLLFYAIASLMYALTASSGAKGLQQLGYRASISAGVFFGSMLFASMFFITPNNIWYIIPFTLIAFTLYRIFYWIPYHVAFAKISDGANRGKQLAVINIARNLIGLVIPILSGFIISQFGFDILFIIAIFMYLVSMIPFLMMPSIGEKYNWRYADAWRAFFAKKNRGTVLAFMADGADSLIGLAVWPIFIFEVLEGNYFEVGAISTLIIGVVIVLDLIFGKFVDGKKDKAPLIRFGSILYSLGYVLKIFVSTGFQIFIIDTYHGLSKVFMRASFDTLMYDMAADEGSFVDEFTVLHEMAVHIGRTLMACAIILLLFFAPLRWAFLLSAIIALLYSRLRAQNRISAE